MTTDVRRRFQLIEAMCKESGCNELESGRTRCFKTYLQRIIIYRIDTFDTQTMSDQNENSTIAPVLACVAFGCTEGGMGGFKNFGFVYRATVYSDIHTQPCLRESADKSPAKRY